MMENHVKSNIYRSPLLDEIRALLKLHDDEDASWMGEEGIHKTILRTAEFAFDSA